MSPLAVSGRVNEQATSDEEWVKLTEGLTARQITFAALYYAWVNVNRVKHSEASLRARAPAATTRGG